ncbi:MAG TPA: MarR family transcriptional regulator [Nocardioides sp.]|jgi:DNA-binding MarR family transcriptional regulator|uniref:MarR family winged helix-turn-helix transcriptional regulator n=1 Tax=Nocardioides sp. TaxID=35761 RepID=UPI002B52E681|nr:MarR family transcriptional regulator [Nocardioides sp.]HTW13745.1 MarR family transcriptional regulator [Nocardioides sp.]
MIATEQDTRRVEHLHSLEQEVGVLIRRVRRVIGQRSELVHPQLQYGAYLMLGYLINHGPLRASALAEVFDIDKGAISRQIQHLEELGLVDRTPDPADGRASLVSASAEATRRFDEVAADRRRWLDERLGDWTESELGEFAAMLRRYNETLGN